MVTAIKENWQDVRMRVEAFRALEAAETHINANHETKPSQETPEEIPQEAIDEAINAGFQEFDDRLGVTKILTIIRDEIWKEGEIRKTIDPWSNNRWRIGFELVSNPYPRLVQEQSEKGSNLRIDEEQAIIATTLRFVTLEGIKNLSVDGREVNKGSVDLSYYPSNIYNISGSRGLDVSSSLRKKTFNEALAGVIPPSVNHSPDEHSLHYRNKNASDHFASLVVDLIDRRTQYDSHPQSIRKFTQERIAQLPPTLAQAGRVDERELRNWAMETLGVSKPLRFTDRIHQLPWRHLVNGVEFRGVKLFLPNPNS